MVAETKADFLKRASLRSSRPEMEMKPPQEEVNLGQEDLQSKRKEFLQKNAVRQSSPKKAEIEEKPMDNWDKFIEGGKRAGLATLSGLAKGGDFIANVWQGGPDNIGPGGGPRYLDENGELTTEREPDALSRLFKQETGYEPSSFPEHALEKTSEFVSGGIAFPGGASVKLPKLLADVGAGTFTAGAEELEAGAPIQVAAGTTGSFLPEILKTIANPKNAVANLLTTFDKAGKAIFRKGGQQAEEAALRQKINLPAAEILNNKAVQKTAELVAKKKGVGGEWVENVDRGFADSFLQHFTTDPKAAYAKRIQSGKDSSEVVAEVFENKSREFSKRYDQVKKSAPKFQTKAQPIADVIDDLKASLPGVSPETREVWDLMNRVENKIFENKTATKHVLNPKTGVIEPIEQTVKELRDLGLEELVNLRSDINSIFNHTKNDKGVRKLKKRITAALNESIEPLKTSNPEAYKKLKTLDSDFKDFHEAEFGYKALGRLMKAETGDAAVKAIRNPEEYIAMSNILDQTPRGKKVLKEWNQQKMEDIFQTRISNAKQGKFSQEKFLDVLNDPETATWLEHIMTPSQKEAVQDMQLLSNHMVNGSLRLKAIAGANKNTPELLKIAAAADVIGKVWAGEPISAMKTVFAAMTPKMLAKMYTDPKFQQNLIEASKAAAQQNMSRFERKMRLVLQQVAITSTSPE